MSEIVVTGVGLITAVGADAAESWAAIQAGICGIRPSTVVDAKGLATSLAGQVSIPLEDDGLVGEDVEKGRKPVDRCHELAVKGLAEALADSGLLDQGAYERERVGLAVGTLLGGDRRGEAFFREWQAKGLAAADSRPLRQYPPNAVVDRLAEVFDLRGPRTVPSNACAAGAVAVAYGVELIEGGQADAVIAGGVDPLSTLPFGGFSCLESLDTQPCAPYTRSSGLTLGEGAGFLVLERREAAEARGAKILAVIAGYGLSADAYHPTAPDPSGDGAYRAMAAALTMAGLAPEDISYVNGHGTGTPANDSTEARAVRHLFSPLPPISSTKSMIGHTLGAAGAVEAVVTVLAIRDGLLPPTVVPEGAALPADLDIVPSPARAADLKAAVSTSFAFGGNNAAIAITAPGLPPRPAPQNRPVVITGFGAVVANGRDTAEVEAALAAGDFLYGTESVEVEGRGRYLTADVPARHLLKGIDPKHIRKMDTLSKRAAIATAELLKGRGLSHDEASATGLFFATGAGPISSVAAFQRQLLKDGSGNARVFPNTVMNAAPGHVALLNHLQGPTLTICAGGTGAVSALFHASRVIAQGAADRVIVLAADESPMEVVAAYSAIPGYLLKDGRLQPYGDSGRLIGGGAVALLLEAEETAPAGRALGRVTGFGLTGDGSGCGLLSRDETAWARSFSLALEQAGLAPGEVDAVISAAGGRARIDDVEGRALARAGLDGQAVFAPKGLTGDLTSASPLLGLAITLWLARRPEAVPGGFGHLTRFGPLPTAVRTGLVSSYEPGGSYQAVTVSAL
ncbi:MAG: beta-ketoacyl-[acyl-carrier-protein] synthase family protein [Propionibacteriaceae bacterium]|jgi:3-oxoacyl-[acyl-carrier-protein] synthase II|nr:beta-ketoacyl-[acyl-carrier-protein] synthase family protein [Propionibacteriaceae bacterium]